MATPEKKLKQTIYTVIILKILKNLSLLLIQCGGKVIFMTLMKKFIEWTKRKKRKKKSKVYFNGDSFQIKEYKVTPVHKIIENISYNQELDFYISTKYDTYLLRLINNNEEHGLIYPAKDDGYMYIVSKLRFNKSTIINSIDKILNSLREIYGFPNIKNPNIPIEFSIKEQEK